MTLPLQQWQQFSVITTVTMVIPPSMWPGTCSRKARAPRAQPGVRCWGGAAAPAPVGAAAPGAPGQNRAPSPACPGAGGRVRGVGGPKMGASLSPNRGKGVGGDGQTSPSLVLVGAGPWSPGCGRCWGRAVGRGTQALPRAGRATASPSTFALGGCIKQKIRTCSRRALES